MTEDNFAQSLNHIAAVHATRDHLTDLFRDPNRDPRVVAKLSHDLGDALKLADVHASLAIVDALGELIDVLDERRPRIVGAV